MRMGKGMSSLGWHPFSHMFHLWDHSIFLAEQFCSFSTRRMDLVAHCTQISPSMNHGKKETLMNTHDQHNFTMQNESRNGGLPGTEGLDTSALPAVVDRATFQAELDRLRVREKAHTREGDTIAAVRRRLPMVEVDPTTQLIGPNGPLTLLEAFEGRRQLVSYYFMWYPGQPASKQCQGCTWV